MGQADSINIILYIYIHIYILSGNLSHSLTHKRLTTRVLDDDGDIPNTDDGHSECYADFKEWATESPSHCLIPGVPVAILLAVAQSIRSTFLPRPRPENGRVRRVFFWSCHVCVLMMLPSC